PVQPLLSAGDAYVLDIRPGFPPSFSSPRVSGIALSMSRGARGLRRRVRRSGETREVVRERAGKVATARLPAPMAPAFVSLGPPDEVLEEVLASLPIKRRRFLRHYLATGNARQAVRAAGYNCTTPQSETSVAQEILENPLVQHAQRALLHRRSRTPAA